MTMHDMICIIDIMCKYCKYIYIYTCGLYLSLSLYVILHSRISRMENSPYRNCEHHRIITSCYPTFTSTNSDFAAPSAPPNFPAETGPGAFWFPTTGNQLGNLCNRASGPNRPGSATTSLGVVYHTIPPKKNVREGTE